MNPPASVPLRSRAFRNIEAFAFALTLLGAFVLRTYKLDLPYMWCDEAESALNALTILQHGYPSNTYLGLPIFENVFTEPWPEHPEYEFRDSSYSRKGVAVYHGWLPLYAIAASMRAFGIEPGTDTARLQAKYSPDEVSRRLIAARLPSAFFGVGFLAVVYMAGRQLYGRDAAWAGLLAAALAVPLVHASRQARYNSLTLLLCMACCLLIWHMSRRAHWRDYLVAAIVAVLLFHTHVLTFLIVCIVGLIMLPLMLRHHAATPKLLVAGAIALAGIVPWMLTSGFFQTAVHVPKAIELLKLPQDLLLYPLQRWPVTVFLMLSAVWLCLAQVMRHRLPEGLVKPFLDARAACWYLIVWGLIGWLAFMLLIPAASLWFTRAYLGIVGPGIVLGAILFAGVGRVIGRRWSLVGASVLFLGFIYANLQAHDYSWNWEAPKTQKYADLTQRMRDWKLRPGTRIYATPSDHLILTYYTDVPVQSIAPVRKSFIDQYPADVVMLECFQRYLPLRAQEVLSLANRAGATLSREDADTLAKLLTTQGLVEYFRPRVAHVSVVDGDANLPLPNFTTTALDYQRRLTFHAASIEHSLAAANPAIFRGFDMPDFSWWWQVFFYRFVGVEQRSGENLNYADRIRNATAIILPTQWVVLLSPGAGDAAIALGARVHQGDVPSGTSSAPHVVPSDTGAPR